MHGHIHLPQYSEQIKSLLHRMELVLPTDFQKPKVKLIYRSFNYRSYYTSKKYTINLSSSHLKLFSISPQTFVTSLTL